MEYASVDSLGRLRIQSIDIHLSSIGDGHSKHTTDANLPTAIEEMVDHNAEGIPEAEITQWMTKIGWSRQHTIALLRKRKRVGSEE